MTDRLSPCGYAFIELLFAAGLVVTLGAVAVPNVVGAIDDYRGAGAVRYLTARLARARMEAIARSSDVAVQFLEGPDGYTYAAYVDGNNDGIRTRDIQRGLDRPLTRRERLADNFRGVVFAVAAGLPPVDAGEPTDGDPIKLGAGNLLSFSALGTSSSGSIFVRGRNRAQFVIRTFGQTGKIRALKFDPTTRRWRPM